MCPSTYAAIGFIQALIGNTQEAIDSCHRALGIRRDDTFTTTLLGSLMEQILAEESGNYLFSIIFLICNFRF